MEETTLDQIPRKTRELYEKAMSALERGNAGYALDMLKQVIAVEPRFALGRQNLRIAQVKIALAGKPNAMTKTMAKITAIPGCSNDLPGRLIDFHTCPCWQHCFHPSKLGLKDKVIKFTLFCTCLADDNSAGNI